MKNVLIILLIAVVIILAGKVLLSNTSQQQISPTPTPVITTAPTAVTTSSFCSPQDLQAGLSLSPGAGNIFGTVTLKNISTKECTVVGDNSIVPSYDQAVKNISVTTVNQPESSMFQLAPNQTLYSQVHYPNGPQCSSSATSTKVTFNYSISPSDKVTFGDVNGNTAQSVTTCTAPSEITTIQVWDLSSQPIIQ